VAHQKRKKAKNQRAGCLLCKRHKINGYGERTRDRAAFLHERDAQVEEALDDGQVIRGAGLPAGQGTTAE